MPRPQQRPGSSAVCGFAGCGCLTMWEPGSRDRSLSLAIWPGGAARARQGGDEEGVRRRVLTLSQRRLALWTLDAVNTIVWVQGGKRGRNNRSPARRLETFLESRARCLGDAGMPAREAPSRRWGREATPPCSSGRRAESHWEFPLRRPVSLQT